MSTTIIPTLRYADAAAAIAFLVEAFAFDVHLRVGDGAFVEHAQLTLGDGMVMLGSVRRDSDRPFDRLVTTVADAGAPTMTPYVVVEDVHAHADRGTRGRCRDRDRARGPGLRRGELLRA